MASLSQPHWETVTPAMRELLDFIGQQAFSRRFYLAGGTALALQLGHRRSVDLDFFSESDEVTPATQTEILAHLAPLEPTVVERAWGHFLLVIRKTQIGFFAYGYPLLRPTQQPTGLALADPVDIGMMKLDALISRAARKDFYDLYFITRTISLDDLLAFGEPDVAVLNVLQGLVVLLRRQMGLDLFEGGREFLLTHVEHPILCDENIAIGSKRIERNLTPNIKILRPRSI